MIAYELRDREDWTRQPVELVAEDLGLSDVGRVLLLWQWWCGGGVIGGGIALLGDVDSAHSI